MKVKIILKLKKFKCGGYAPFGLREGEGKLIVEAKGDGMFQYTARYNQRVAKSFITIHTCYH